MKNLNAAVLPPYTVPPQGTELVLFSCSEPYIPQESLEENICRASEYARQYGVFLVPQRFMYDDCLCLCLFDTQGEPVGVQRAVHLNIEYREKHMRRDVSVTPFDTTIGRIALLVDVDFCRPQAVRQAVRDAAEIIIASQYVQICDFDNERLLLTAESAVKSNGVPVIAAMNGSGIICPVDSEPIVSPFDDVPINGRIKPGVVPESRRAAMHEAYILLRTHRDLFVTGGDDNGN